MTIPVEQLDWIDSEPETHWTELSTEAKRERILCAAGRIFSTQGLDAPMPAVAAQAGAGVATVYRQFPSKRDLIAALVTRRLGLLTAMAQQAAARPQDHWQALTEMLWTIVARRQGDDFMGEAWAQVLDHPDVIAAGERTTNALGRLLDLARAEGRLRADASTLDLRLLFAATRAAKQVEPDAWQRTLELFIDGLASRRG